MHRVLEYGLLFLILVILQVFFFNGLNLSLYFFPLVYVLFIGALPTNINSGLLLILGCITGIVMDLFMGFPAVNTIASLFTAFIRPAVIRLTVGKDAVNEAGVIRNADYKAKPTFLYYLVLVFAHCLVFFMFEALAWMNILYTLLRTFVSGAATLIFVLVLVNIYPLKSSVRS